MGIEPHAELSLAFAPPSPAELCPWERQPKAVALRLSGSVPAASAV